LTAVYCTAKELEDYLGDKVSVRIDPLDPKRKYWVNTNSIVPDAAD
jgi:hypothetical protein